MDKEGIKIIMSDIKNPRNVIPILGKAYPTGKKGFYGVKTPALIKTLYAVICPQCRNVVIINSATIGVKEIPCEKCHAVIILKAVTQQGVNKAEEFSPDNSKGEENAEDPPQESKKEKETSFGDSPKKTVNYKLNNGKVSNAKLVWWSITGRKKYILRVGKNYVGRKDKDKPSDLSLNDEYASAQSICIEVKRVFRGYVFQLTVERATNPVLIAGKDCPIGKAIELNYGDTIVLGNTTLTLKPI